MSEAKTYSGSCHCGKVRFEATTDLKRVVQCNCSICARLGYMLTFMPPEQFKLLSGEGDLKDYQFNKKNIHHPFCATCGIESYAWGKGPGGNDMVMLNVRCLDGVDAGKLPVMKFDGASL